nr:hypothetical protein [Synechococcus sp. 1G10]
MDHHAGEFLKQLALMVLEMPGLWTDHTERSESMSFPGAQRSPCVKADVGIPFDQRIVPEAIIILGIAHNHHLIGTDRVRTESHLPCRFTRLQTHTGEKPLTTVIDERDQRDRHSQHLARDPGDAIKVLVWL